jgi:hypothetical protein
MTCIQFLYWDTCPSRARLPPFLFCAFGYVGATSRESGNFLDVARRCPILCSGSPKKKKPDFSLFPKFDC